MLLVDRDRLGLESVNRALLGARESFRQSPVAGDGTLEAVGGVVVDLCHGRAPDEVGRDVIGCLGEHVVDGLAAVELDAFLEGRQFEAALGGRIEVPTLDGRVAITVPPGSQDGRTLRVPGKGAPKLNGSGSGSLLAKLRVIIPSTLTDEEREVLKAFADLDDDDPRARLFT